VAKYTVIQSISREKIAEGKGVRDRKRLKRKYGGRKWIKCKGRAKVQFHKDGSIRDAEVHWYEAHGVGGMIEPKVVKVVP
jgi:hypothetical protein